MGVVTAGFIWTPNRLLLKLLGTTARPGREEHAERQGCHARRGGSFLSSPQAAINRSQNLKILVLSEATANLGL
jgi:hypothetical protein